MTFFTPEDDLNTYNQLNEYSDIADSLTVEVDNSKEISLKQKQDILYPIIDEIRDFATKLIDEYIIYLKDQENMDLLLKLENDIDSVIEKVDFFKNKIYEVYKINNKTNE